MKRLRLLTITAFAMALIAAKCDPHDACKIDPTLPICQPSPSPTPQPEPSTSPSAPPATEPSPPPSPTPMPSPSSAPTPAPSCPPPPGTCSAGWEVIGTQPDGCAIYRCVELPSPQPTQPPGGTTDVTHLLVLNYGKCVQGEPFVFYLGSCKELLITATPKADPPCQIPNCDATDPSRKLTWFALLDDGTQIPLPDGRDVDVGGIATVSPGPIELTFNRTVKGLRKGTFRLQARFIASNGQEFDSKADKARVVVK